jgi:urease subunit gamma/beta
MRLLPREQDRLLLFLAAELARQRRTRGVRLGQAEAEALVADTVCEAARDGLSYADVEAAGYAALGPDDVLDGVAELLPRVEVEPLFADGPRLIVLEHPIARRCAPQTHEIPVAWLGDGPTLAVVNRGEVLVGVSSHFHFFEVNRALDFDRVAAWGMRLAVDVGVKVFFPPGEPVDVRLAPIGGARVVRGHAGLVDGPLDAPGARAAALALARERGYRGA